MKANKKKRLEAVGWKVGTAAEFLGLDEVEERIVALKVALALRVKALRKEARLTQNQLAKQLGSSQSRVAKLEVADTSVSIDLLLRAMVTLNGDIESVFPVGKKTSVDSVQHTPTNHRPRKTTSSAASKALKPGNRNRNSKARAAAGSALSTSPKKKKKVKA